MNGRRERSAVRSIRGMWAAAAVLAVPFAGCDLAPPTNADGARSRIVVTQVPAAATVSIAQRDRPDLRYPAGSRIVLAGTGGAPSRVLTRGFEAAGAPAVSPGGDRVVFAGRREPGGRWGIWETGPRGRSARAVIGGERDCVDPAWLAGNAVVAACTDPAPETTWSLYTAERDGSAPRRITFGPQSAFDPTPLADGRVLFAMWQPEGPGRPASGAAGLFTINPDGTMLAAFWGHHEPPARKLRPRALDGERVALVTAEMDGGGASVALVPMNSDGASTLRLPPGLVPYSVEPWRDGTLLVAVDGDGAAAGVRALGPGEEAAPLFHEEGWREVEAVALTAHPPPRGRPVSVDPARSSGQLICYDAGFGDGVLGPARGDPPPTRISIVDSHGVSLGDVPLAPDGSFSIELPADTPVRIVRETADGRSDAASGWFWVRPGEVRACFGCHEPRGAAPPNRKVLALAAPPRALAAEQEAAP